MCWEPDPKHLEHLKVEYGLLKFGVASTPLRREGIRRAKDGQGLDPDRSRSARRCIAILKSLSQDKPDLCVAALVVYQQMSDPTEGTEMGTKRVVHVLAEARLALLLGVLGTWRNSTDQSVDRQWLGWRPSLADHAVVDGLSWKAVLATIGASFNPTSHCPPEKPS